MAAGGENKWFYQNTAILKIPKAVLKPSAVFSMAKYNTTVMCVNDTMVVVLNNPEWCEGLYLNLRHLADTVIQSDVH